MLKRKIEQFVREQFAIAGITIDGTKPWDIQVLDKRFYQKVLSNGSLGLGESYMDGWFKCDQLDETVCRLLIHHIDKASRPWIFGFFQSIQATLINFQNKNKALEVGKKHYDIGNELFTCMLDKRMCYSCGYWKNAKSLDEAQEAKLELVCQKLGLQPGMKVLDIGCGWGSFAKYAAEKYHVNVVGITISKQQLQLAQEICKGLPIQLRFQDYRDVNEPFDRIISIGQMEHVGYKNYRTYMEVVNRNLNYNGLFLLHTIGNNTSHHYGDPWLDKYIFPNGMLPSAKQLTIASEGLTVMEDWHSFGPYYDTTLMYWYHNFEQNYDKIKLKYDERFYRMWRYYLLMMAGSFRARNVQLWQIVYSKHGVVGGYNSVR